MGNITKDLAWKEDIPQQFTSAEMTEIKNAISQETANVNVKPYHIYSPNEQVVGEWQEMRGGVLKKKPVYERYVFNINVTPGYNVWVSLYNATSLNVERLFIVSIIGGAFNTLNLISSGMELTLDNGNILAEYNQTTNVREVKEMCFQYTKTTDEWQTVE